MRVCVFGAIGPSVRPCPQGGGGVRTSVEWKCDRDRTGLQHCSPIHPSACLAASKSEEKKVREHPTKKEEFDISKSVCCRIDFSRRFLVTYYLCGISDWPFSLLRRFSLKYSSSPERRGGRRGALNCVRLNPDFPIFSRGKEVDFFS